MIYLNHFQATVGCLGLRLGHKYLTIVENEAICDVKNLTQVKKGLQVEGCLGRRAEVGAFDRADDVSVAVDVAHELLQAPEAALAHAQETLGQVVVERLQLRLDVGQDGSDQLDDGDDQ